jgi:DNA-binding transcriptional LysR family regulator
MHNPLDMLVFAKVVELQSFSLTARRLGISRSAASKHVSRLEQALGARLLNRTTRKLSLTEPGHAAYAHCARIAAEVEASELSVQRFVSRPKGLLRVSAPAAFGRLHLVPILPEYLRRHPDVSIDLVLSDRLVDLVEERFDIAIQSSPLTPANLIRRDIAPIRWVLCAAPSYLKRFGTPDDPEELRRHNCIFYASAAVRGDVWSVSRKGETRHLTVSGNFRANNSEAVRDAALGGLGLALLPTFAMWQDLKAGALVRVLPDWTPHGTFGASLTAYFIADRQLTPKIRTLVDFLAERFGRSPAWDRGLPAGSIAKAR